MNVQKNFDVCVIGAGAGGLSCAAGLVQLGLSVALIEKGEMGGDCLNTGCVPSKALIAAAGTAHAFRSAKLYGIAPQEPEIDFRAVKDHVYGVIDAIAPNDSQERFEKLGVKVFRGTAEFTARDRIQVNNETIGARYFIIATGSRAAIPQIKGLDPNKTYTNETIFALREKPEHLVIVGGGPIGMEMAQAHRRLGCKVTVLECGAILPKDDPELVDIVRRAVTDEGVRLLEQTAIQEVSHGSEGVTATLENGQMINGSHLLAATGRRPNIEGLGLENAGVEYDQKGVKTDASLRTTNKRIFAVGDVTGGPQFTHVAGYHAGLIVRQIAFRFPAFLAKAGYRALPWVTYTDPELANIGQTHEMAKKKYGNSVEITRFSFDENDRAIALRRTEGLLKVVSVKGRPVGAAIAGPDAGELISLWGLAIRKNLKMSDIASLITPYPTLSEISKRAAGAYFTPSLFSPKTKTLVKTLHTLFR